MFQEHQRPPFARLAAHWSRAANGEPALAEDTRAALALAQPSDLPAVQELVAALHGRLASPSTRELARRALFTLLDAVRRRAFTLRLPGDVSGWTRLLTSTIEATDYTFAELLRSREETDPKTVALRVLGSDACDVTVADLSRRSRALARGILALLGDEPGGRVARHPAAVPQLLAVLEGSGVVSGRDGVEEPIGAGDAVVWDEGEEHETWTETGLVVLILEGRGLLLG